MTVLPNDYHTTASTLPHPVVCTPMDEAWKDRCREKWWGPGSKLPFPDDWKREAEHRGVMDRCLSFGGETVCMPNEDPDIMEIFTKGVFIYGDNATLIEMQASNCHENVMVLFEANPSRYAPMTGYALSDDGVWRSHSWLVDLSTGTLVETTKSRTSYFGFTKV